MTVPSINGFLTEDHGRLDALLEGFQEWKAKDLAKAKEFLAQFVSALHRHLQWEETILFPLFEQKTGNTGLTRTLLGEHQEIRDWLKAVAEMAGQDETDSSYEERMLVEELGGHNAREEYALYPELDKLLADDEKSRVFGLLPKKWSRCYESLKAMLARRTLDEADAPQSRADRQEAAGRGWDAGGRPVDRRGVPGPGG